MGRRMRQHEVLDRLPPGPCIAAEVGVWRGHMSAELLRSRRDLTLLLVDPWKAGEQNGSWRLSGSKMAEVTQERMDFVKREALSRVAFAGERAKLLQLASLDAAACVLDGSMDLVFIDADHSYEAVSADICAWLPKVKSGGWIGGHDYLAPRFPGVAQAVRERFEASSIEAGANATWFVRL